MTKDIADELTRALCKVRRSASLGAGIPETASRATLSYTMAQVVRWRLNREGCCYPSAMVLQPSGFIEPAAVEGGSRARPAPVHGIKHDGYRLMVRRGPRIAALPARA